MTQRPTKTTLKLLQVRRKHGAIERNTKKFLAVLHLLERIDSWLQILLDCHTFAVDERRAERSSDYMESYAAVAAMGFSTAESARLLLLRGFYGNNLALLRALLAQNDLIADLSLNNISPTKWLRLRSFKLEDTCQEAKSLRRYFHDSSVRKRLKERGESPLSDSIYGVASEAVHTTAWASQLFSAESLTEPGVFDLEYRVQYDPVRALNYAKLLQDALPHLSGFFLEASDPHYRGKDARFDLLTSRYMLQLDAYEIESPKINEMLRRYDEGRDRVAAGEDYDSVFPPEIETTFGKKAKSL